MNWEVTLRAGTIEELVDLMHGLIRKHSIQPSVPLRPAVSPHTNVNDCLAGHNHLIEKMFEMIIGSTPEHLVLGRNVPMCIEVDAIKLMEHFGEACPKWHAVAKKYRELRAQPTSIYAGKAIE